LLDLQREKKRILASTKQNVAICSPFSESQRNQSRFITMTWSVQIVRSKAPIGRTFQNSNPIFQGRFKQFPEYGEAQRTVVYQRLERLDRELNGHRFIVGDRFTIADITALVASAAPVVAEARGLAM
jgi:glutathione S-transferase